jgi:hypothetical protein
MVKDDSESPVLVSNLEVLELLQKRSTDRESQHRSMRHRNWIEQEVIEYLQAAPCVRMDSNRLQELQSILQSSKRVAGSTFKTTGFALTEAESLQIVNSMPTEPVEIHLLVEELQSRMTEKQQEELLTLIKSYIKEDDSEQAVEEIDDMEEDGKEEETFVKEESENLEI